MLHDLKRRVTGWIKARNDIRKLRACDNYLLADMGIEREHIAALVKGKCKP